MLAEDEKTDLGIIKIHNNVIASVAYLAALEVEGVSRICDDLKSMAGTLLGKKTKCGAIDIKTDKGEGLSIIIPLVVKYGFSIPDVASKVQEKVKSAVEETTDLTPRDIIVKVKGVER